MLFSQEINFGSEDLQVEEVERVTFPLCICFSEDERTVFKILKAMWKIHP